MPYRKQDGRHVHRIVAEEKLGRKLIKGEVVHHIDNNSLNNDPDNLMVLPSQADHARLHHTKNRKCEIMDCDRKHFVKGMCQMHYQRILKYGVPDLPPRRLCGTPGCEQPHYGAGLCNLHWQRLRPRSPRYTE